MSSIRILNLYIATVATLVVCHRLVAPLVLQAMPQHVPIENVIPQLDPHVAIGSAMPRGLANIGARTAVVVHINCLQCAVSVDPAVEQCFRRSDLLNLVLASDPEPYREIALSHPGSHFAVGDEALIQELHAAFGPRLYVFDRNRRLVWVQDHQALDMIEVFDEALGKSR